jgi:hypothetical protein
MIKGIELQTGVAETPTPLKGGSLGAQLDVDPRMIARKNYKSRSEQNATFLSMRRDIKQLTGHIEALRDQEHKRQEAARIQKRKNDRNW